MGRCGRGAAVAAGLQVADGLPLAVRLPLAARLPEAVGPQLARPPKQTAKVGSARHTSESLIAACVAAAVRRGRIDDVPGQADRQKGAHQQNGR